MTKYMYKIGSPENYVIREFAMRRVTRYAWIAAYDVYQRLLELAGLPPERFHDYEVFKSWVSEMDMGRDIEVMNRVLTTFWKEPVVNDALVDEVHTIADRIVGDLVEDGWIIDRWDPVEFSVGKRGSLCLKFTVCYVPGRIVYKGGKPFLEH